MEDLTLLGIIGFNFIALAGLYYKLGKFEGDLKLIKSHMNTVITWKQNGDIKIKK